MPEIARSARDMIAGMTPQLRAGEFVFVTLTDPAQVGALTAEAISVFREAEGVSMILPRGSARRAGLNADQPMRCITLSVYSSLDGVGLTAAVSAALGNSGNPCNMVAAYHHDHVFVPAGLSERAMATLTALQQSAGFRN